MADPQADNPSDQFSQIGGAIEQVVVQNTQSAEKALASFFPTNLDMSGVRSAAEYVTKNAGQLEAVLRSVIEGNANIYKEREANVRAASAIKQAETAVKLAGELQTQNNNRSAASAFGVNPDDVNQLITTLGENARNITLRISERQKKIQENAQSPSVLGQVVGFIQNEFLKEFNAADGAELAITTGAMQRLNQAAQAQISTNNAITQKLDTGSVARATQLAAIEANDAALALRQQAVRDNVANLEAAFRVSREQLNVLFQVKSLENQETDNARQAELLALQRKQYGLTLQRLEKEIAEGKAKEEEVDLYVDTVNQGRAIMGLPKMTRREIEQYRLMGGAARQALEQQYESGALNRATGVRSIAPDPANAGIRLRQSNVVVQGPQQKIQEQINEAFSTVLADKTIDPKNAEAVTAAVNKLLLKGDKKKGILGTVYTQIANIKPGDETNIYQAPAMAIVAKADAVKSTPLYNVVLAPQVQAGINDVAPKDLLVRTAAAVQNGTLKLEDAVEGIVTYYKQVAVINNADMEYTKYGLPRQASYNVNMSLGMTGAEKINLMDPTQVATIMSRALVQNRLNSISTGVGSFGFPALTQ